MSCLMPSSSQEDGQNSLWRSLRGGFLPIRKSTTVIQFLRKVAPLAAGTEYIHHPVHDRAHVGSPLAAALLGWRNKRFDRRPLVIRQIARVSQVITIVFRAILTRPHRGALVESGRLS
jgi:hypothetical protein